MARTIFDSKSKVTNEQIEYIKSDVFKSNIHICSQIVINWAGFSQVEAVLSLLQAANDVCDTYSYVHFFQGSDMPIKTQDEIHEFFLKHNGKEFVNIEKSREEMAKRKAKYYHFFCHNRYFRKNKLIKALNFGLVYMQKILHIEKNTDIKLYQGSALFSITGQCAKYILSRAEEIRKRFKFSLAVDEVFIQSVLMDSPYREKIMDIENENTSNARMIDRTRPDGKNSPHIWRKEEVEYLLNLPANFCFARKFDERKDLKAAEILCDTICCKGEYQ